MPKYQTIKQSTFGKMAATSRNKKIKARAQRSIKQVVAKEAKKIVQQVASRPARKPKQKKGITKAGQWLRTAGGIAGTWLGNPALGRSLGAGVSRIFGQGDYQVKQNSLMNGGPPSFAALNTGVRMSHREYISDITSTTAFGNTTYQITPTNSTLFPWLSSIASNFEEYQFRGLVFYFNTTCGSAISSTNNALGVIGMTTVYDPTDPDLASKREAEDYGGCVSGVPSCSILHPVECKPQSNVLDRLYVQANNVVTNLEDWKFYSHGKLNVFTQGMQQAAVNIGELWVSYDIEFFNPKILPIGTTQLAAAKLYNNQAVNATNIFGTSSFSTATGNLPVTMSGKNLTIQKGSAQGYYLINWMASTSPAQYFTSATSGSSNITLINYFQGSSTPTINTPNAAASVSWYGQSIVVYKSDANDGVVTFNWTVTTTVPVSQATDITVVKLPNNITGLSALPALTEMHDKQYLDELFRKHLKQSKVELDKDLDDELGIPELIRQNGITDVGSISNCEFTTQRDESMRNILLAAMDDPKFLELLGSKIPRDYSVEHVD